MIIDAFSIMRMDIVVGDHIVFYGEILAASAEGKLFKETWKIENEETQLLHHLGGRDFYASGQKCQVLK